MKLNNKGFLLREMLIITAILLLLLLVAAYYIFVLYHGLDTRNANRYLALEAKMEVATRKYMEEIGMSAASETIITYSELNKAGHLQSFEDENGKGCTGYAKVSNYNVTSYIKCKNYESSGYRVRFDK